MHYGPVVRVWHCKCTKNSRLQTTRLLARPKNCRLHFTGLLCNMAESPSNLDTFGIAKVFQKCFKCCGIMLIEPFSSSYLVFCLKKSLWRFIKHEVFFLFSPLWNFPQYCPRSPFSPFCITFYLSRESCSIFQELFFQPLAIREMKGYKTNPFVVLIPFL